MAPNRRLVPAVPWLMWTYSSSICSIEQRIVERRLKLVLLSDLVFTVLSSRPVLWHVRHVTPFVDIIELVLPKYVISPPHLLHSCVLLSILLTLPSFFNLLICFWKEIISARRGCLFIIAVSFAVEKLSKCGSILYAQVHKSKQRLISSWFFRSKRIFSSCGTPQRTKVYKNKVLFLLFGEAMTQWKL